MKKRTAALWLSAAVAMVPVAARAQQAPYELNTSAAAQSGADRMGGATITSPPHTWTATGQSPDGFSSSDLRKEFPRNRHVVGPPVPRQVKAIPQPPPPPPEPQSQTNN
jgi:hypothetical protein